MDQSTGKASEQPTDTQQGNQAWWTRNTMSYDWKDKVAIERFSRDWFDEIDHRFIRAHTFAHENTPFDRLIPFERLAGKSVLEIGCGMGLHSSLLAKAGADLYSIDISPTSVEATQRRFELFELDGRIEERDAEQVTEKESGFKRSTQHPARRENVKRKPMKAKGKRRGRPALVCMSLQCNELRNGG